MRKIIYWIEEATGITPGVQEDLLLSVVVIVVVLVLSRVAQRLIRKKVPDIHKQYRWNKLANYFITGLGLLWLANIWFNSFASVATFLGLLSAGLVLALKEPVLNMAGWLFIIWKRPFRIGDRIQIGDSTGDVIDIRLFQFTINEIGNWVDADQTTGRIIYIPNGRVFTVPQSNYNYGFPYIWNEISLTITFESNWKKAKKLALEIGEKHSEHFNEQQEQQIRLQAQQHLIFIQNLHAQIYTNVRENGIRLTLRYLCSITNRRGSENEIWEDIITAYVSSPDIFFAYPTTRFYQSEQNNDSLSGK